MALLSPQQISKSGLQATYSAANASDTANPDDDLILHVKNGGASPITVTLVDSGQTAAGSNASNPTVTVTNATEKFIWLPAALGLVSGIIQVNYSATTSVTAALLKM